jgi:hypothetical protein
MASDGAVGAETSGRYARVGKLSVDGGQDAFSEAWLRRPRGSKQAPVHLVEAGAVVWSALGAPSAGLSLGGLHACRARLRFTRHTNLSHAWREARRRQKRLGVAKPKLKQSVGRLRSLSARQNPATKLVRLGNISG